MHITYRITTCTYTKLIHIHSRGFMHMGLAKSDACWFTRGLWDSLCMFHISFFQTKPYLYKATRPTSVGENACAKGNVSTFARERPGASYWSSFTIEVGSLEEMAGSFPLGNPPFSPCFFHPFSDRNGGFHQNSSGSLGSSISSILASGKLTDSYGKNTSFKTLRDKFIINHHKSSRNGQSSMTMCYNVVQNQRLIIWYHRVLLLQVFPSSELPLAIFSIPS